MLRRLAPILLVAVLSTLFLLTVFQRKSWRTLPQAIGLGEKYGPSEEEIASGTNVLPDLRTKRPPPQDVGWDEKGRFAFQDKGIESGSPYPLGQTKPAGSNYTKGLVIAAMKADNTAWIADELSDLIASNSLTPYIYIADDRHAPLHPPRNKGHEGMVYFTYIISHYDSLPDVSIFMHAHRFTWHNNLLLSNDASTMVRLLSAPRVVREGYMNLRCHWDPGCPSWMHPGATERNVDKQEEQLVANAWAELFPHDPIPTVLAQPCCAQFAVSAQRIRELPKQRYVQLRDWLLRTELSDYLSGRVFEYVWQYIFTLSPFHCPSMSSCYCDGYGLCFNSTASYQHQLDLIQEYEEYKAELKIWEAQAETIRIFKELTSDGRVGELAEVEVPQVGLDGWLRGRLEVVGGEIERGRGEALERGKRGDVRAESSGREWREGDGV